MKQLQDAIALRPLVVRRLGRVPYARGLEIQESLVAERQAGRVADHLLLLEHDPVFTLGRNARQENVLFPAEALRERGFDVFETGRGGDVTYHGPGQVVGYPILELPPDRRDVHRYVRDLEEVMIRTCADYGIEAGRVEGLTGTWVGRDNPGARRDDPRSTTGSDGAARRGNGPVDVSLRRGIRARVRLLVQRVSAGEGIPPSGQCRRRRLTPSSSPLR